MKSHLTRLLIAALIIIGASTHSLAQTQGSLFSLKVDGIMGESQRQGHEGEIDAFAFNLGVTQRGISDFGGGAGAGKSQFLPVVVYKNVDSASPALFLACATGQHIKKVELKAARPGIDGPPLDYLVITLTDVIVSSLNHQSADGGSGDTVLETLSLNFAKIEISYRKQNPDGSLGAPIKAAYDLKLNKKL